MSTVTRLGMGIGVCLASVAYAGEADVQLVPGPGREQVVARCAICHSLDYITMNSPLLDSAGWDRELEKMIAVMGAPVTQEERVQIQKYLTTHYGQ